jgi:alpha-L-fucosidase
MICKSLLTTMRVISYPSHASRAVPRARPFLLLFLLSCFAACRQERAPQPRGAVPEPRQMAWHEMEYYAFVHFNMNTFTGKEWGYGDESPALFNPSNLDCRQWARIARDA